MLCAILLSHFAGFSLRSPKTMSQHVLLSAVLHYGLPFGNSRLSFQLSPPFRTAR
jgi:hypothetical protein